jgi:hypothetical protein
VRVDPIHERVEGGFGFLLGTEQRAELRLKPRPPLIEHEVLRDARRNVATDVALTLCAELAGEETAKAIQLGLDKRQIDEVQVFNLAASRPDLITGPGGAPYGSVGVDINCAVIGYIDQAPTNNLADPVPNSQFPPL